MYDNPYTLEGEADNYMNTGNRTFRKALGGTINTSNMKYTQRLPKNKRHIAPSLIGQPKSITGNTTGLGTALSFAGPAMSIIGGLNSEQDTIEAKNAILAELL